MASPWRRCARYSKKRTQALEEERVGIPKVSGEFVARMEDVLDLYQPESIRSVRIDETSRQLTGEVPAHRGCPPGGTLDTEYQRNGTRNLFMICEPGDMWMTERRTAVDFAPDAVAGGRGLP